MRKNQPFFLLNCFPQVFVTAMKNWLTTQGCSVSAYQRKDSA
jgi:hypothetical protein